jgi:hypothetical protein
MKKIGWFSRLSNQQPSLAMIQRLAGGIGVAALMTGIALAQNPTPAAPLPAPAAQVVIPNGYSAHGSVDAGGHMVSLSGSNAMYDTMVNIHSGPRVLGGTFEMRALPGAKHTLADTLSVMGGGFGGDPYNFAKLDFSKGKIYDFSGLFRRDRQYFDYDLLGNPGIPSGYSIPISGSSTPYAWPQVNQSPFMFNTVRRMTDTSLTLFPLSKVTFHAGYSHNTFEGPSLTPSGDGVGGQETLLQKYQRNSSDDFTGTIDWKPIQGTKLTFEEQIDHNKIDSYFTMDPSYFTVQEAGGTKVALLDSYQNYLPYGYNSVGNFMPNTASTGYNSRTNPASGNCNAGMVNPNAILSVNSNGGAPIIDPACNVITSYTRSQPTREIFPTEIFRFESTSIKNVSMNGDFRYTNANMNLPNYSENFQGLDGTTTGIALGGFANARRQVMAADYGIVWEATKTVSLEDQVSYSNAHQPGTSEFTRGTTTKIESGADTINNLAGVYGCTETNPTSISCTPTPLPTGTSAWTTSVPNGSQAIGTAGPAYFGQRFLTNNFTGSWDATPRATFSLTYRYSNHVIAENAYSSTDAGGIVTINENGGIFNVALRPTDNWNVNGSVEMSYADNVFTPVSPRQTKRYRVHTLYRPKSWATLSAAFNDLERHDNTNNTGTASAVGPLGHEDHTRVFSLGADLMPNEHYGLDLNYAYNDVYTATNICFDGTASVMPNSSYVAGVATPSGSLCAAVSAGHSGALTVLAGPAKDFEDAPTQYGSVALALSPVTRLHSNLGYRISSVNGSRFFTDAMDVNGSMVSTYQTPFVNVAWTVHQGLILKANYDYYGYGEGGRSGAQWCANTASLVAGETSESGNVEPCSAAPNAAMNPATPVYGFTAPRNFHANNVTLSVHYDF